MSFPYYQQFDDVDCGPTCLRMIAKHYGRSYSLQSLREKSQINRDGVSLVGIAEAAEAIGFRTMGAKMSFELLVKEAPLPCIVHWDNKHFIVVYDVKGFRLPGEKGRLAKFIHRHDEDWDSGYERGNIGKSRLEGTIYVADPNKMLLSYDAEEFKAHWLTKSDEGKSEGVVLLLEPTPAFYNLEDEHEDHIGVSRLTVYLRQYGRLTTQIIVGLVVTSIIQLTTPFLTQSLVDVGISTHSMSFVYLIITALALLILAKQAIEYIRSWILLHISTRLNLSILSDFLIKLMRLPLSFFDTKKVGDIFRRVDDNRRIEDFLTGQSLSVLFSVVDLFLLGIVLLWYNTTIFIIFAAGALLHVGWVTLFLKRRRVIDFKRFDLDAKKHNGLLELISGIPDIKLAGAQRSLRWAWERLQARLFHLQIRSLALGQYQHAGGFVILRGVNLLILFVSIKAVMDNQITLGVMLAIQFIVGQLNGPVEQVIQFAHELQDAHISLERFNEIHTLADEEDTAHATAKVPDENQDISFRNVNFYYPGMSDRPVLQNFNLDIPKYKTTAIVGASGSGKTTLVKLMLRFYKPVAGEIMIGKSSLKDISFSSWRSQCGVVMQEGFIFSQTIAQNIALGEDHIDFERLRHAMEVASISDFVDELPLGINTKVGAEGNGLSQGQKQRLLIARAVYKRPQYLFFDEATNALDANNEMAVMEALNKFFDGRTVIIVAHRLSTVKNADNIVVLEKGRIVEQGNHTGLVTKRGAYWELVKNQLELEEE